MACSSSMMTPWLFRPSSVFDSDANASSLDAVNGKYTSLRRFFSTARSSGLWLIMLIASVKTFFAWSFLVAIVYISAAPSPSPISRYRAMPASSVDLPFFLATSSSTSRKRRYPFSFRFQPNSV